MGLIAMVSSCATTDDLSVSEQSSTALATQPLTTVTSVISGSGKPADEPFGGYQSATYRNPEVWLCLPDTVDVCDADRRATAIYPNGTTQVIVAKKIANPAVDCFYVYPTASHDMAPNSDLVPNPEDEMATAWAQVSRYSEVCNVYAPMYRQRPVPAVSGLIDVPKDDFIGGPGTTGFEIAYSDVLDAFRHYISSSDKERGFLLIGHSQGTAMLTELIRREVDRSSMLRERFVSAHLLGGAHIDAGGNEFKAISTCKSPEEVGCIIAYNTFYEDAPPNPDSWFGRTWHHPSWEIDSWEDLHWEEVVSGPSLCVNPRTFTSEKAQLMPYFTVTQDIEKAFTVTTPWVTYPGLVVGECINDGTFGYLSIEILANPKDPRAAHVDNGFDPESGLHGFDINIALGDLIAAAKTQSANYSK